MSITKLIATAFVSLAIIAALAFISISFTPLFSSASVVVGNEYNATTTYSGKTPAVVRLKSGFGTLGSVVITGDNTGQIFLYNATTSNINLRAPSKATSTLELAVIPASTPEGTYTYDVSFSDGLLLVTTNAAASSTITYR